MVLEEDVVQGECQGFEGLGAYVGFQLAFPDGDAVPSHGGEALEVVAVAFLVPPYLLRPEFCVCLWQPEVSAAFVSVPEASVHHDDGPVFPQHQVGVSGQSRVVQPVTEATAEEEFPHQQFGLCVLAADGGHALVALLLRQFVHICFWGRLF